MVYRRIAGHFFRYLWLTFAVVVIVYALIVVAGRELLPVISRYQPQINAYLSEKSGMDFEIGALRGLWEGSTPLLDMQNIVVVGKESELPALTVDRLSAEINLLKTVANVSPVWRELSASKIQINLIEDEAGRWSLGGFPLGLGSGEGDLEYLFRMLYYSRLLRIDQVIVDMHFFAGSHARLYARDLQLENAEGFHRTTASIALSPTGKNIADFVFEGKGDPADVDEFVGQGYLHLQRINIEGSLNTVLSAWFPDLTEQIAAVETELDFSFWFDWKRKALVNGRGHLTAAELPLVLLPDAPPLEDLKADITGWYQPGDDWGLRFQQVKASWGGEEIEPLDFQFRQRVGRRWGELDVAINHLDLAVVSQTLLNANIIGEKGEKVIASLHPQGALRHLFLDVDFSGETPAFQVKANMAGVSVGSWKGTPAAKGIEGYVEAGLRDGFVVLDTPEGFSMHYHQVYRDFMPYGATRGKVAWQWLAEQKKVFVTSNLIDIDGEEGQGKVFLHLDLPTVKDGDPQMYLMVGMKNSHTRFVDRYLPKVLNTQLSEWLAKAVGDGDIPEAGFIWRGSLKKANNHGRSIQVYARMENGAVNYQPGWPAAEKISASLVINNTEMDVLAEAGEIASTPFRNLGVNLRQRASGPLLRVAGEVDAGVGQSLGVLADSPLRDQLAGVTGLDAQGAVNIALDLRIPLSNNKTLEDYRVNARLRNSSLAIPGTAYKIEDIRGAFAYRRGSGLASKDLKGTLWGQPLTANIATEDRGIVIGGQGTLGSEGLRTLLAGYSDLVTGETPVAAELVIPQGNKAPVLTLASSLKGLQVQLPAPFGKEKEQPLATQVNLEIENGNLLALAEVEGKLAFVGQVRDGVFSRGGLHLLANSAELPEDKHLQITGRLPTFNWSDWQPVLGRQPEFSSGTMPLPDIRLDLQTENFVVGGFSLEHSQVEGSYDRDRGWLFAVESPRAAGKAVVSNLAAPLGLELEYLKLPRLQSDGGDGESSTPESGGGFLDTVSPLDIPEMDVSIQSLYYDDDPIGNIAFKSRRLQHGASVSDIEGSLRGILIKPQPLADKEEAQEQDAAQLQWTVTETGNNSYFSGTLEIEDVEAVLAGWDIPAPYTSQSSAFFVNLGWKGKPWQVNTLALDGYLGIDFRNGQFYETTGGAAGAFLKLIGLINFDTWLRRLRFDFSDFFSDGLSFDRVEGGLLFREGVVDFEDPVIASMPSGKIRLLGSVDLIYEQLDATLVATMPVGTNLPWVAGLLGGLPAAAGVFLTSKLFEKQVDQLSSIGYKVTGSLDDPKIEVQRIFSDPTKLTPPESTSGESDDR